MMAHPKRHIPRDASRRRVWVYLAIIAFVVIDIVLIVWALGAGAVEDDATSSPRQVSTAAPRPAPSASPVADEPIEDEPAALTALPAIRLLAAVDATTAWRAATGGCPATPASPEVTTDAGATWRATDATAPTGVTALQRIIASSAEVATMIGLAEADCAPQLIRTFVGGTNYSSNPAQLPGAWYLDPADRASVHGPVGTRAAPCNNVVALAPRDVETAAVLCADGRLFATADAAANWSAPTTVTGAIALARTADGYAAAAAGGGGCGGVQIVAVTGELVATPTGCLPLEAPAASLPGTVSLSDGGGTLWLWSGDELARSSNLGATWL